MSSVVEARGPVAAPSSLRGQERVSRILDAATELFLRDGYNNTSVDAIVEKSGGSKATLYSYFPTKADLFRSVVDNIVSSSVRPMQFDSCETIRAALQEFGEARLRIVFSKRHQALLRLVVAERDRFPDLALMYYEQGPKVGRESLIAYLTALRDAKKLDIDDVEEATKFFIGMLLHEWYIEHLLFRSVPPTSDEISHQVSRVVDRFLALYHREG